MFNITETPNSDYKLAVFQPIVIKADIITDQYPFGGGFLNQNISIVGANEDGNCICTWAEAVNYIVGDSIYLLSGIYKGKHKIYRVNGSINFHILTKYITNSSYIGVHYIASDTTGSSLLEGQFRISKFVSGTPVKLIDLIPTINESDNTIELNVAGYLKTCFQNALPILSDDSPNLSSIIDISIVTGSYSLTYPLIYAAKPHIEIFEKQNSDANFDELIIPMVSSKIILFQKYNNKVPFNTPEGIYELTVSPNSGTLNDYIDSFVGFFNYYPEYFEICTLCASEALVIHFLNKYGAYQTYVPIGNYSFGKTFIDPKDITDYQGSKLTADSGMIYKTCTIEMTNLNKFHIEVLEELIESPIAKILNGEDVQECTIEKKDFEFYKTVNEYHNAKLSLIFSQKINVQTR